MLGGGRTSFPDVVSWLELVWDLFQLPASLEVRFLLQVELVWLDIHSISLSEAQGSSHEKALKLSLWPTGFPSSGFSARQACLCRSYKDRARP